MIDSKNNLIDGVFIMSELDEIRKRRMAELQQQAAMNTKTSRNGSSVKTSYETNFNS